MPEKANWRVPRARISREKLRVLHGEKSHREKQDAESAEFTKTTAVTMNPSLIPFFAPQGIVLFGATADPTRLGFGLARNLAQSGYSGAIHFVNPKGGQLLQRPLHPTLATVPDPVDLALLLVPAPLTPGILADCGQRGIRAAIILSGGFRETDEAGARLEAECLQVAHDYGMRLIGPNCVGLLDTHLPLNATFLPAPGPAPGDIAFISHSGAICSIIIDWAAGQGFGLSRLVSLGNQADVDETDALTAVAADPHSKVITLYLEGVKNGRRFSQIAQAISRQKPIVALKVGRFAAGQQAAASHTGALAGSESAFAAACRRAGILRAESSEQQFDWARALAGAPLPQGRRVAILTDAGGPGVTAADALEANDLQLAQLHEETIARMAAILPPFATLHNPVDILASGSPEQYADCLRLLLADPGVDSVLLLLPTPPMYTAEAVAQAIIPIIRAAEKPVLLALMGERSIQAAAAAFRAAHVPEYRFPERAASALAALTRRAEYLARANGQPIRHADAQMERARELLAGLSKEGRAAVPTAVLQQLLAAYGLRLPELRLARTAEEAAAAFAAFGHPVALKIASPDILHKSDVGGVMVGVEGETAVAAAFAEMIARVRAAQPEAVIEGVHVQPMIPPGQEVIIGALHDPQFGPVVMFGSGGVEVEGLGDVAFALAPLTEADLDYLLANTWAGRRLAGFRHLAAGDITAVRAALSRLAQLAADFPELAELEINPLRVLPAGAGVYALDARAILRQAESPQV
jgi:acetate---CoA ligase (ADP-forming)